MDNPKVINLRFAHAFGAVGDAVEETVVGSKWLWSVVAIDEHSVDWNSLEFFARLAAVPTIACSSLGHPVGETRHPPL